MFGTQEPLKIGKNLSLKRNFVVSLVIIILFSFYFPYKVALAPPTMQKEKLVIDKEPIGWGKNYIIFSCKKNEIPSTLYKITLREEFKIERLSYRINYFENLLTEIAVKAIITGNRNKKLSLEVWFRLLENEDLFIFLKFKNEGDDLKNFEYTVSVKTDKLNEFEELNVYRFSYHGSKDKNVKIVKTTSLNFPGETVYLKVSDRERTKLTLFKGLLFQLRDMGYGLQERVITPSNISINPNVTDSELQISNYIKFGKGNFSEDWYLFSEKGFLNINSAVTQKFMEVTDFSLKKKYFENGFYYLTENNTGYRNENKNTYYLDYSMYAPRSLLEFYFTSYETFIYDIVINSFFALHKSRNKYGFWFSSTESIWLKSEYNIGSNYFDTRFSVEAAIFAAWVYKKLNIKEALNLSSRVGDLILSYIKEGNGIRTKNNGFLLCDYIVPENKLLKTHSSLNHILNEIYFLLLLYDLTENSSYKDASIKLINGISYFGNSWINSENGDLYYCRRATGKFERRDYTTLTYYDLIKVNKITKKVLEKEFEIIKKLGKSKELFLLRKGVIKVKRFTLEKEEEYVKREKSK